MANFAQRSDTGSQGRSPGRQPIVLARIPRVGAEVAPAAATIPMPAPAPMPETASHLPAAPIPQPEPMPRLDLQTEIQQQLRLHAPHPPEPRRMHAMEPETTPSPSRERKYNSQRRHGSGSHQRDTDAPTGIGQRVYQLHTHLAPHAGLIVAMALIASAGLLYWMIVGPAHMPALHSPQYSQEIGLDGFGANHVELPADSEQLNFGSETDSWAEVPLPGPEQMSTQPPELLQSGPENRVALPAMEAPALEQLPMVDGLQFPTTSHPEELNFSRIRQTVPGDSSKPEMAGRPANSMNR